MTGRGDVASISMESTKYTAATTSDTGSNSNNEEHAERRRSSNSKQTKLYNEIKQLAADAEAANGTTGAGDHLYPSDSDSDASDESDTDKLSSECSGEERDEVKEIERLSRPETVQVRTWKGAVTLAFIVTAVAVTITTFFLLKRAEYNNFIVAYWQFARTLADSATEHQKDLRESIRSVSNAITVYSASTNATWPYFYMPQFEGLAADFKAISKAEVVGINNIVSLAQRKSYIDYITQHYQDWVKEGHLLAYGNLVRLNNDTSKYNAFISTKGPNGFEPDIDKPYYHVRTTLSPPVRAYGPIINWNTNHSAASALGVAINMEYDLTIGTVRPYKALPKEDHKGMHTDDSMDHPHSFVYYPIHRTLFNRTKPETVATVTAAIAWDASMRDLLPESVNGIFCVIRNSCGQTYSYLIDGPDAYYKGEGDLHETKYDDMQFVVDLALHTNPKFKSTKGHCMYSMSIYPSCEFEASYDTRAPETFAAVVGSAFALVSLIFFVYDRMVNKRNTKLIQNAAQTSAIVTGLFPDDVRNRLIEQNKQDHGNKSMRTLNTFLTADETSEHNNGYAFNKKPLADLFLDTTVIFADIVGFTAWSSQREPSQVFRLLETVYYAFDRIAKRRRVFKVETVGDCYVAVCGLPQPRGDHAMVIIRFARDIMKAMRTVTRKLEILLGPDTGDLSLRIGVHSGPVTGGVLRGERSRFQLFGDTMNTAARIEHTGLDGRIQISQETANHIIKAGKESWLKKRVDKVTAKGKGELETYWVKIGTRENDCFSIGSCSGSDVDLVDWNQNIHNDDLEMPLLEAEQYSRLINWNAAMLLQIVKQIVARRNAFKPSSGMSTSLNKSTSGGGHGINGETIPNIGDHLVEKADMPLEEVKEIIALPKFNRKAARRQQDADDVVLPPAVIAQLQDYVRCIANMYRGNSFHSFEHASHVVMSVIKLMSRIVAPKELEEDGGQEGVSGEDTTASGSKSNYSNSKSRKQSMAASLHDHTYGITSDPLTQFACAFSALIHDVDHNGVPNPQLIKEDPQLARRYQNRSVAEQNSFDLSWDLLMKDCYKDLRATLCATKAELMRFRQLVINSVMATDLGDKELKALRNARWEKAFSKDDTANNAVNEARTSFANASSSTSMAFSFDEVLLQKSNYDAVNRKATIVIEHIIQASDVSHTMQHWHIYRKWNECLFREIYEAYRAGRCENDPSENWYKGEIGFFDFYIIPLAKKLKDCGVFGISSDEYLNYAIRNRQEWVERGQEVVAEMIENMKAKEIQDRKDAEQKAQEKLWYEEDDGCHGDELGQSTRSEF